MYLAGGIRREPVSLGGDADRVSAASAIVFKKDGKRVENPLGVGMSDVRAMVAE